MMYDEPIRAPADVLQYYAERAVLLLAERERRIKELQDSIASLTEELAQAQKLLTQDRVKVEELQAFVVTMKPAVPA